MDDPKRYLDLQEGPTSHLRDLWTSFKRVNLALVRTTIPIAIPMGGVAWAIQLLPHKGILIYRLAFTTNFDPMEYSHC